MKKITFVLMLLCTFVGQAFAEQLFSNGIYTLGVDETEKRGFLGYGTFNETTYDYPVLCDITWTNYTGNSATPLENGKNWYLVSTDEGATYYFYNVGAGKFMARGAGNNVDFSDTPYRWTIVANSTYYNIGDAAANDSWVSGGCSRAPGDRPVTMDGNEGDGGSLYTVTAVADGDFDAAKSAADAAIENYENAVTTDEMAALVALAKGALSMTGPGAPKPEAAGREDLQTAIDAAEGQVSRDLYDALQAQLVSFASTTDVVMPEDGKAYRIKAKYNDGSYRYFYRTDAGKLQVNGTANELPANASSAIFVARSLGNDKYAFAHNSGEYLVYYASGKNTQLGETGAYETVDDGFAAAYKTNAYFTLIPAANKTATHGTSTVQEFFGAFVMQGFQGTSTWYMLAGNPDFHNDQASAIYYQNGNRTSVFCLEEVEYANTPDLKTATGIDGVEGIATFCAPFATVIPENVDAWYASSANSETVNLTKVEGEAIPANQGVVLTGAVGQVTMLPVAGETVAEISGNLLSANAAGSDYVITAGDNAYVLAFVDGAVQFAPANLGSTLGMNKSYLQMPAVAGAVKLNFGEVTAVEKVEVALDVNAPLYDLSGRRVKEVTKGVFIQNGKKFIVK